MLSHRLHLFTAKKQLSDWNFVFGKASLVDRVGVFSFARYDPRFWGEEEQEGDASLVLRRTLKVCVHEIGHMYGISHCVYFSCFMNGSNRFGRFLCCTENERPLKIALALSLFAVKKRVIFA